MHTVKKKVRPCAENNTHRRVAKATSFHSDAVRSSRSDIYAPRPFTRAIRKLASSMLSAAAQLLLLMKQRSLRGTTQADFRASTNLPVGSHG